MPTGAPLYFSEEDAARAGNSVVAAVPIPDMAADSDRSVSKT